MYTSVAKLFISRERLFTGNGLAHLLMFALAFFLVLSLLVMPGGCSGADDLRGTYIRSDQQEMVIPIAFYEFYKDTYRKDGKSNGRYAITGNMIEFVSSDGRIETFKFSRTPNVIMFSSGAITYTYVFATSERVAAITAARRTQEARKADKTRKAEAAFKSAGFIASSDSSMAWPEAKKYCQQQGGRLPLIDDSESLRSVSNGAQIEGFGPVGEHWPSCLDRGSYWTDTQVDFYPSKSWIVYVLGNSWSVGAANKSGSYRVVCVQ